MNSPAPDSVSAPLLQACGTGCRYAETLHGDFAEWIWCNRPGADPRLRELGSDCSRFEATGSGRPRTDR